jgi:hypothetical protein
MRFFRLLNARWVWQKPEIQAALAERMKAREQREGY